MNSTSGDGCGVRVESATAQVQAVADDVESVRLAIQAEVAADYFTIRALDADKALLLSSIEVYRKSLELVRNRRAGGMVSDLDVAQAETVLKTAEAQLPDNALQRARFEHALAVLTGKNASLFRWRSDRWTWNLSLFRPAYPRNCSNGGPTSPPPNVAWPPPMPTSAWPRRRFSQPSSSVGQAGFWSGDLNANRNMSTLLSWPSQFWAVGPSLTQPLFQGGQLSANLRQAKAAYEETVARYRQTVLTAFADVENNLAAEYLLARQYEEVLAALKAARRQLEVANNRYDAGLVTYLEVATAQNTTLGIERSGMRLRGQQLVAAVALIKSLGGGWPVLDTSGREP